MLKKPKQLPAPYPPKLHCPLEAKLIALDIFRNAIWNLIRTSLFSCTYTF